MTDPIESRGFTGSIEVSDWWVIARRLHKDDKGFVFWWFTKRETGPSFGHLPYRLFPVKGQAEAELTYLSRIIPDGSLSVIRVCDALEALPR